MQSFPIKEKEEKYLRAAIRRQGNPRLPAGIDGSPGACTRDAETEAFHVLFYLYEFIFYLMYKKDPAHAMNSI